MKREADEAQRKAIMEKNERKRKEAEERRRIETEEKLRAERELMLKKKQITWTSQCIFFKTWAGGFLTMSLQNLLSMK
mgnify:CR=1 FL=1